jgi:hypothetical protein
VIRIEREGDNIWVTAPPYLKDQVRQIPGARHDSKRQAWKFPLSWAVCVIARGVFGQKLEVGPELVAWANGESARIAAVMASRAEAMETDGT